MTIVAGVYSLSRAAAYIIGLKAPWLAFRLHGSVEFTLREIHPPTRALTKPVSVSTASNAPRPKALVPV